MTDKELIDLIEAQRLVMIAVATGGPRIQTVNSEYIERRDVIRSDLDQRGLQDPNPHNDLWNWYGKWSSGDLPSYQSRREYISDLYGPLVRRIREGPSTHGAGLRAHGGLTEVCGSPMLKLVSQFKCGARIAANYFVGSAREFYRHIGVEHSLRVSFAGLNAVDRGVTIRIEDCLGH